MSDFVRGAGIDAFGSRSLSYAYAVARGYFEYYVGPYLPQWNGSINEVSPSIFIGDVTAAHDLALLRSLGITHVVSTVLGLPLPYKEHFQYHYVGLRDTVNEDLDKHNLHDAIEFIRNAIHVENGRVLVHCMRGASRSVTVVAAYLMCAEPGLSATDAIERIRVARPIANPNASFRQHLNLAKMSSEK